MHYEFNLVSRANWAFALSGARSSAASRVSCIAGIGVISGCLRQYATVRTATPRYSANDSLVMRRDCRSKSASLPVHNSITCTRAGLSVAADMSSHRGDVEPEFCQKPENFGKPRLEGLKARPQR